MQDADRLDAIGAVGVLRCAAYSGARARVLCDESEGLETAEGHFPSKLLKVRDRMKVSPIAHSGCIIIAIECDRTGG